MEKKKRNYANFTKLQRLNLHLKNTERSDKS